MCSSDLLGQSLAIASDDLDLGHAVGYPGQILVKASSSMGPASFIYDWGDGRAAFDPEAAAGRVAEALHTALAAEGLHAEPLLPPERAD